MRAPLTPARTLGTLAALCAIAVAALAVALSMGSVDVALRDIPDALLGRGSGEATAVVRDLRMPRALAAFAVGGLLALAGALMQVLLRNPLADPYVLGLSSGSAIGALGAMLLGLGAFFVQVGATAGALLTVALVFALARRDFGVRAGRSPEGSSRLLLTGVVLASGWSAIVTLILVVAPESQLRGMLFWLMGDLGGVDAWTPALVTLGVLVALLIPVARDMNVLLRGDDAARALGVDVARVRRVLLLGASLATAVAVTTAGAIGFVGLVVPHALRLAFGNDQRVLLPACALGGGALLVIADTLARSAFAPQQVPVGALTALIGVPAFVVLLARGGRP